MVRFAAGMRARVGLESARFIENFPAARPRALDVHFFIAVRSLMRRQRVAAVVTLAATFVLANIRRVALIVRFHMQFQCPLRLKFFATVRYLANNPVWTTMQFLVAPQIVDSGETTVATLHLAHMILALQMRLLMSF